MASPKKPCKHCGSDKHWPFQCFKRPKQPRPIRQRGKAAMRWDRAVVRWLARHKAPTYTCYICGRGLMTDQLTLDHVKPRSSHPDLRYTHSNLEPCCWTCNSGKGSKSIKSYIAERDRLGLAVSDYARQRADQAT